MLDTERGATLIRLACEAIAERFGAPLPAAPDEPWLAEPGATFVTLTQNGQLRGCIGSLEARRLLDHDVRENALAAALRDPRFPPLRSDELASTRVEVSLLTAATPLHFVDQEDALRQLRPGVDGVILEYRRHRSTFLPQVWESLAEPRQFLAQLKSKAGLPADFWDDDIRLSRYRVEKWKEGKEAGHPA